MNVLGKFHTLFDMEIPVLEFLRDKVLAKNQNTQRKLLNFANWCSGVVLKSAFKSF